MFCWAPFLWALNRAPQGFHPPPPRPLPLSNEALYLGLVYSDLGGLHGAYRPSINI